MLKVSVGIFIHLAAEWTSLHHVDKCGLQLKSPIPHVSGPTGMLVLEGAENSRIIFLAILAKADGVLLSRAIGSVFEIF